jgi:hypothetical protein
MRRNFRIWLPVEVVALFLSFSTCSTAQTLSEALVTGINPKEAARGTVVTVTGSNFKASDGLLDQVNLCHIQQDDCKEPISVTAYDVNSESLKFVVSNAVPVDEYKIQLGHRNDPSFVRLAPDTFVVAPTKVELAGIDPATSFPNEEGGTFSVTLLGSGFSTGNHVRENVLRIAGKPELHLCPILGSDTREQADEKCPAMVRVNTTLSNERTLVLSGIPAEYSGIRQAQVVVGQRASNLENVTFSRVGRWLPLLVSVLGSAAVIGLVLGTFYYFKRHRKTPGGTTLGFVSGLLLDEDTNTYSLSKAQFFIWTLVSVLGYLYLTTARSMVQGQVELSDIPTNLATILGLATGTGILAMGISNTKGSKGSGETAPLASDLITSGGVVAPERLQFLVWTIIAAFGFLALTYSVSPADITELPTIPEGILLLSGVSAAGYLGGKLARPAGPKLTAVSAEADAAAGKLTLTLTGSALLKTATFYIDEKQIMPNELPVSDVKVDATDPANDPTSNYASAMTLNIANLDPKFLTGEHQLTIMSPTGEKSVSSFTLV